MRYTLLDTITNEKITLEIPFDLSTESIAKEISDKNIPDSEIINYLIKEKGFLIIPNK